MTLPCSCMGAPALCPAPVFPSAHPSLSLPQSVQRVYIPTLVSDTFPITPRYIGLTYILHFSRGDQL
jgi:hypothetical protein